MEREREIQLAAPTAGQRWTVRKMSKSLSGWISVKDRLPEPGEIVLVMQVYSLERYDDGAVVTIGRLCPDKRNTYWEFQYYRRDFRHRTILDNAIICPGSEYVTHWMHLPDPPELAEKCPLFEKGGMGEDRAN